MFRVVYRCNDIRDKTCWMRQQYTLRASRSSQVNSQEYWDIAILAATSKMAQIVEWATDGHFFVADWKRMTQWGNPRSCECSRESFAHQLKSLFDFLDFTFSFESWQWSFILRASSDILPTPLHQKRWRVRIDASCDLCAIESKSPTVLHILKYCPTALNLLVP